MTAGDALRATGIDDRDARILLAHAWGIDRASLSVRMQDALPDPVAVTFRALVSARKSGAPVSKLIGRRAFWKADFIVTQDVLDPRPETETLVELAVSKSFDRVLDLGTGSGCILLSVLGEHPDASGVGIDVSDAALDVAHRNTEALGLLSRVTLLRSDWFAQVDGVFDLIVSNPPYIAADEMAGLSPEVRGHDPQIALTPGGDGLAAYRRILADVQDFLSANGRILVEIGPTQAAAVMGMMSAAGLVDVTVTCDLDGRDRVISGRKP